MIKVLKYVGFIASGVISYMLMTTLCETTFDYMLAFAMTLVLQASSFYFFDRAIKEKDRFKKTLSSTLAIMLFLISIIGTVSFQFSIQNNAKNQMIVNSDAYILAQKQQERKEQLVKSKADELETHRQNLEQQLLSLDDSIAEYRRLEKAQGQLYTTRIANLNKEKNQLRADFSAIVQKANQELVDLSNKANEKVKIAESVELSSTKGYLPLLETFAKWLDVDLSLLTLIFQSFIACIFELTAIALHIEDTSQAISKKAKILTKAESEPVKPNPTKEIKPTTKVAVGFKMNDDIPSEKDIKTYISSMENPNQKGICRGYKKISEITGLKQEDCRTIKGILERRGVIETVGTKTKILG